MAQVNPGSPANDLSNLCTQSARPLCRMQRLALRHYKRANMHKISGAQVRPRAAPAPGIVLPLAWSAGTPLPVQGRAGVQRPSSAAQVRRQLPADLQFGCRAARGATAWLRHAREREAPRSFSAPFDDTMRMAKLDGRIRTGP